MDEIFFQNMQVEVESANTSDINNHTVRVPFKKYMIKNNTNEEIIINNIKINEMTKKFQT